MALFSSFMEVRVTNKNCIYLRCTAEKAMAPHSSTLAWKIPRMEQPDRLLSMGSLRLRHDWLTSLSLSCIGEGNGNTLQCSCLENPRGGGAWLADIYGVAWSQTRLKRLTSRNNNKVYKVMTWYTYILWNDYHSQANYASIMSHSGGPSLNSNGRLPWQKSWPCISPENESWIKLYYKENIMAQLVKNRLQCRRPWFDPWLGRIHWRRERLLTPVFWYGEFHGLYSP